MKKDKIKETLVKETINTLNKDIKELLIKQLKIKNLCLELLELNKVKSGDKLLAMLEETYDDTLNTILHIINN